MFDKILMAKRGDSGHGGCKAAAVKPQRRVHAVHAGDFDAGC